MSSAATLRKRFFGIAPEETTCARRGFRIAGGEICRRLEQIGRSFVEGYHAALLDTAPATLEQRLNAVDLEVRGFAYEGAAMALALLDQLTPWRRHRLAAFLAGPAAPHIYMAHVGAGWAYARVSWNIERPLARLDPLLRWLAVDGYGFHQGYFSWQRYIEGRQIPGRMSGYALRAFDQGLGRSMWFVDGADVERIPRTIAAFAPNRHADLWSGVGLACAYAGGVDRAALIALREAAGPYRAHMAQGVAFAAQTRLRAGTPAAHTPLACEVFCGCAIEQAAAVTDVMLQDLPADGAVPSYEVWRQRIRTHFAEEVIAV